MKGRGSYGRESKDFIRFIRDMVLMTPLHGRKFTLSNKSKSPSLAKLAKFLYSTQWNDKYLFSI